jgi:hypothetical protein
MTPAQGIEAEQKCLRNQNPVRVFGLRNLGLCPKFHAQGTRAFLLERIARSPVLRGPVDSSEGPGMRPKHKTHNLNDVQMQAASVCGGALYSGGLSAG